MSLFKRAVKQDAKLRLAINGPSGSGKTYTSLAIASILAAGKPIALVDTEHGSASKYADIFSFDVAEMHPPFHPDKYIATIEDAAKAGYGAIILDSLTHAWNGEGGMLDIVEEISKRMRNPNTFAAWKDATPIQNRLINSIISADIHLIATMRSKTEYILQTDERGKQTPKKVGMAAQQRDGFEYEFDVVLDMDIDNNGIVSKTRCSALAGRVFSKPGKQVADILSQWLSVQPSRQLQEETKQIAMVARATNEHDAQPQVRFGDQLDSLADVPESSFAVDVVSTDAEKQAASIIAGNNLKAPPAAQAWAVTAGYCPNEQAARSSWKKVVDAQFGGKVSMPDMDRIIQSYVISLVTNQSQQGK